MFALISNYELRIKNYELIVCCSLINRVCAQRGMLIGNC